MGLGLPAACGAPRGVATQTHDMEFFVRYFVELALPVAAVEAALDGLPKEWFLAITNKAHARALAFMLEADPDSCYDVAGEVVELAAIDRRSGRWSHWVKDRTAAAYSPGVVVCRARYAAASARRATSSFERMLVT